MTATADNLPSAPREIASSRNYATTFVAEGLVLISALLTYRLVATGFGPDGFAEYALARRALTLLGPLSALGLDVAIARFVALALARRLPFASAYLCAGLTIGVAAAGAVGLLVLALSPIVAELFFGSPALAPLAASLLPLLLGATLHVITYSNFRGHARIGHANVLMVANHAILPVLVILLVPSSLSGLLTIIGLGWTAISLLSLWKSPMSLSGLRPRSVELLGYGLRRVPGDLIQLLFFALPAIVVAHVGSLHEAGIVALALSALGMVGSGLTPISFVLLPLAADRFGRESVSELRGHVIQIARWAVPFLLGVIVVIELLAEPILGIYLGPEFIAGATVLRVVSLGALPWGIYVMFKSVLDARHVSPVNARNLGVAFSVFALLALVAINLPSPVMASLVAFVIGLYGLGILTTIEVRRSLGLSGDGPGRER